MEQKVQTSHMAPPNPLPGYTKTLLLTSCISAVSLVTISEPILIKYYQLKSIVYIKVNINCVIHSMALENIITCINHYKHHTKQFHRPKNPLCSTHSSFPHSNPYSPQQPLIFLCLHRFACSTMSCSWNQSLQPFQIRLFTQQKHITFISPWIFIA